MYRNYFSASILNHENALQFVSDDLNKLHVCAGEHKFDDCVPAKD